MEWYIVFAIILIVILLIILGVIIAYSLVGKHCTVTVEQRQPNHELTRIQQEQERKRQKKFGSRLKRAFGSSSKAQQPAAPVEDVKTVQFSLKLGDNQKKSKEVNTTDESAVLFIPKASVTQAELDERQKKRDEIRKKYNL